MIVPRSRLLLWTAIILLPFGTLAGMDTGAAPAAIGAIGLFVIVILIDGALAPRRARGIVIDLPGVLRCSHLKEVALPVRIGGGSAVSNRRLRIALDAPAALGALSEETAVFTSDEWAQFDWKLRPQQRGRFEINAARIEAASPLGFWAWWKMVPTQCEIRVYPNLLNERRNLAALFLNRGAVGLHAQRMVGKGRDFEKLREYIPGDSYDEIHWKATAKRGQPVTKIFQVERTQEIYVVVDTSRLSARAANANSDSDAMVIDRFVTAALVLGLAAEHQGDLFGLLTFSDKVETFIRARNGTSHYHACRDALYTAQARNVTPDFDELSSFIRTRLRRRALLLFLTSLDDPVLAESFARNMDLLCRQHLILVNMLQPPNARPLFTAETRSIADLYQELGGHTQWQRLRELESVLRRRGVSFALVKSDALAVDLVSQYINVKQRQAL
jgi:uncharacterized protein (DUF58 family)